MFTSDALSVLRHADPRFHVGRRLDASWQAAGREIEIPVFWDRRSVGHLEHDEMTERQAVPECFGRYGMRWDDEAKAMGYKVYYRNSWQSCFREIIGSVPEVVAERVRKQLRKRGFRL